MKSFFNNIQKRTRSLLFSIVLLNIVAAAFVAFTIFVLKDKESAVSEVSREIVSLESTQGQLRSMRSLVLNTEAERKKIDSYFHSEDSIVRFIEEVEALGDHAGTDFDLNSVDVIGGEEVALLLNFTAKGSWANLTYLLALLESFPARLEVQKVNIQKGSDEWRADFRIILKSFTKA